MELNFLHLYPDCMSLYGEYANVAVLKRHLEALGITVNVKKNSLDNPPEFTEADFIYMGCGTERTQKAALMTLKDRGEDLKAALDRGAVVLFTGNAMDLLGKTVTNAKGQEWSGMGLAEFSTAETDKRDPEDVIARSTLWESPVVGFMNKCSKTTGVTTPLFDRLTLGLGNEAEHGAEGYVDGNLFATHITGPVLVKNPDFVDVLIRRLFEVKGWALPEKLPILPYEREAYEVTLKALSARVKEN